MSSGGIRWKHWLEMGHEPCQIPKIEHFAKIVNGF